MHNSGTGIVVQSWKKFSDTRQIFTQSKLLSLSFCQVISFGPFQKCLAASEAHKHMEIIFVVYC